jgi:hypothetical protein
MSTVTTSYALICDCVAMSNRLGRLSSSAKSSVGHAKTCSSVGMNTVVSAKSAMSTSTETAITVSVVATRRPRSQVGREALVRPTMPRARRAPAPCLAHDVVHQLELVDVCRIVPGQDINTVSEMIIPPTMAMTLPRRPAAAWRSKATNRGHTSFLIGSAPSAESLSAH